MKHIEDFETYLNESKLNENLSEAHDAVMGALGELEKLIRKESGLAVKLTASKKKGRMGDYLRIVSEDMTRQGRVVQAVFSTFEIVIEGASELLSDDSVMFRPMAEWSLPQGGTNGASFIWERLWYKVDEGKWIPGRKLS